MNYTIKIKYRLRNSQHLNKIHLGKKLRPLLLAGLKLHTTPDDGYSGDILDLAAAFPVLSKFLGLLASPPKNTAGLLNCLEISIQQAPSARRSTAP